MLEVNQHGGQWRLCSRLHSHDIIGRARAIEFFGAKYSQIHNKWNIC